MNAADPLAEECLSLLERDRRRAVAELRRMPWQLPVQLLGCYLVLGVLLDAPGPVLALGLVSACIASVGVWAWRRAQLASGAGRFDPAVLRSRVDAELRKAQARLRRTRVVIVLELLLLAGLLTQIHALPARRILGIGCVVAFFAGSLVLSWARGRRRVEAYGALQRALA